MNQPNGPLARRIAARKGIVLPKQPEPVREPEPPHKPLWLRHLTARDETGRVLS